MAEPARGRAMAEPARGDMPPRRRTDASAASLQAAVPGWQSTPTLTALEELLDAAASVPSAVARRADLSTSELHALRHLARGPLGPADLARILGVTTAASSGVVDRLVARGHAVREPHPLDGRRTQVTITPAGLADAIGHLAPMFSGLAAVDAALTPPQREVVERYLRGAAAAIRSLQ